MDAADAAESVLFPVFFGDGGGGDGGDRFGCRFGVFGDDDGGGGERRGVDASGWLGTACGTGAAEHAQKMCCATRMRTTEYILQG